MSKKEDILGVLAGESGPMNRAVMAKKIGKPTSDWQKQLNAFESQKLVVRNEQMEYSLTEAGYEFLRTPPPEGPPEPGKVTPEPEPGAGAGTGKVTDEGEGGGGGGGVVVVIPPAEVTDETLKTTEYQQFIAFGKTTGVVPLALIEQVARHVWSGGDFRDITWVWHGLTQMGIRPDLAQRWWHSWRSFLFQPIPPALAGSVGVQTPAGQSTEAVGKGKRDYIIGANELPLFVGEGIGDLDYDDAVKLSAITKAALARGGIQAGPPGQPATPGTMADELIKIVNAFKETMGTQEKGKSYIVKPGEEGYVVEEAEQGKPTIITTPSQSAKTGDPPPSWMVSESGEVTELTPGKPLVIKQAAPASAQPKTYIIRQTAEGAFAEEQEPGKPIIIQTGPPPGGQTTSPVLPFPAIGGDGQPVFDKDGQPIYVDIEPQLKWLGFQSEQRRADERQQALTGLIKTVQENIPDGIQAILKTVGEVKGGAKTKKRVEPPQTYKCGDCQAEFSIPPEADPNLPVKCPGCERQYSREELAE